MKEGLGMVVGRKCISSVRHSVLRAWQTWVGNDKSATSFHASRTPHDTLRSFSDTRMSTDSCDVLVAVNRAVTVLAADVHEIRYG
jgi:hypothetical protein